MNIITRLLSKENKSLMEHMDSFKYGATWFKYIQKIDKVGNRVIIRTSISKVEVDKVRFIPNAVFSWANDKTIQEKQIVKYVVILDQNNKEVYKVRNPLSKKYFRR